MEPQKQREQQGGGGEKASNTFQQIFGIKKAEGEASD